MSAIYKLETKKFNDLKGINLSQFIDFMDNKYELICDDEEYINQNVDDALILLGIFGFTSRGFEFYSEGEHFEVRINTPATTKDWQCAIEFMDDFMAKTDAKVFDEDGEAILDPREIDYIEDIVRGIEFIDSKIDDKDIKVLTIPRSYLQDRGIVISREMIDKVLGSENVIDAFDEMLEKVFYSEAYFANQQLYKTDEGVVGMYVIGSGYKVVLPLKPEVEYMHSEQVKELGGISKWKLAVLLDSEEDPIYLDYLENIAKIKNYEKLDANQIEIPEMTDDELIELFGIK